MAKAAEVKATEVKDKIADRWIKIIGLVAVVTFPLVGTIGTLILRNMDKIAESQIRTIEELGKINGHLETYKSRISRNEDDIRDINVIVNDHSEIIYRLQGAR